MGDSDLTIGGIILLLNLISFFLMGLDKRRAKNGGRRIREDFLLLLACVGGSPGIYSGMRLFRHKTRKLLFRLGVPVLLVLQGTTLWIQLRGS